MNPNKHSLGLRHLVVPALIFFVIFKMIDQTPRTFPLESYNQQRITADHSDPCAEKKNCLVAYIAPWCPACNSTLPLMRKLRDELRSSDSQTGFRIIVGADKADRLRAEAKDLGEEALADESGSIFKGAGVVSFPSWQGLDSKGRVLGSFSGGLGDAPGAKEYLFGKLQLPH